MKFSLYTILLFLISSSILFSCKPKKDVSETKIKEEVKIITLQDRLEGLEKMSTAELGDYVVTIDGKTLPVYDMKGTILQGMPLVNFMRENEFVYEVYGDTERTPQAIVLLKEGDVEIVDDEKEIPLPPGMETKLEYAPAFTGVDLNGKEWNLEKLQGKIAVINFWFINCAPCKEEMPALNELKAKYADQENIEFIDIL